MLTVRTAGRADIAAIDALLARAYPRLLKPDYAPSVLVTAIPIIARAQPALVTCDTYFVVEDQGAIIGAGGWTAVIPGENRSETRRGNVRHLVTDDRQVRRGVGRALMEHIFASARGAGMGWMHCTSTITAVPFYQAMGFAIRTKVLVPLAPGIRFPAVAMARLL